MFKGHYVPTYNMVDYTPEIIILPNVKSIGPRRSCVHKISKMLEKLQNSCKNHWIKMAGLYDELHIMANYHTKYESYQKNDLGGVGFAKYNYVANARKLVQWSTEKSHSAKKDAGRTNKWINGQTNGKRAVSPHTIICRA